jgi:hypothetical protein
MENVQHRIAAVMGFVAVTLAVASALHLGGVVHGRGKPFDADDAGVAEAVIGAVLAGGALAMWRLPDGSARARTIGLTATGLAIAGFVIGLIETSAGGAPGDIVYHVTVLPILIACLAVLLRRQPRQASPDVSRTPERV